MENSFYCCSLFPGYDISTNSDTCLDSTSVVSHARIVSIGSLPGVPDYFDRNKISNGGDLSHYSSASLY